MIDGLVNFNLDEVSPTIIKVIGVGGGGGNAVEYMYSKGICDVDLWYAIRMPRFWRIVRCL